MIFKTLVLNQNESASALLQFKINNYFEELICFEMPLYILNNAFQKSFLLLIFSINRASN
ncbi:hypothetical protein C9E89_007370 [Acinetobacter sichuanensis]|uniref:Uncharacterized protein n=1 Tax=Acinetobacter sichuanensis TaxID=2136183 RepID=A0A371YRZ7_9GAMM|nr:hypothetical protein C9E89_007370 [Acinetobacter sichuanensis]